MFVSRGGPRYSESEAREAVSASISFSEALRRLGMRPAGGNHMTLKKYVGIWGISTAHFDPAAARVPRRRAVPLEAVLVAHSTYSRRSLKKRLYAEGLKQRTCELCGQGEEWHGRRMALIIDHINGVATDNRLENLQIVCPNCAATLETHCGRNVLLSRECLICRESFQPTDRRQRHCSRSCSGRTEPHRLRALAARTVERPPYDQLMRELAETSWSAVGRKYGVSDNAVRKWVRWYEAEADAA
jgi:hypothetical protein